MRLDLLQHARRLQAEKRPVAIVTRLDTGVQMLLEPEGDASPDLDQAVRERALEALRHDRSTSFEHDGARWFVHALNPPRRLVIVGAVHVAQPLSEMAALAGFGITIIDPRGAFATAERFPNVTLLEDWPDEALSALEPDARTALVTLTHDPKLDDPALEVALRSDVFYIGALGSRKTHAGRLERLRSAGFTDNELSRIHGPIGLPLGGRAPAEIAVSILAQIIQVRHGAA